MRGSPGRRRHLGVLAAVVTTGVMLAAHPGALALAAPSERAAASVPGSPGIPQPPTVVYAEDFENGTGQTPILLNNYTGAPPTNAKYTAASQWIDAPHCNGIILNQSGANQPACQNQNPVAMSSLKFMANVLGVVNGAANPSNNHAVSAYTDGANPGANRVEFQTVNPLPLPTTNRFITFSVDVAAQNCSASAPRLQFYLTGAGPDIPAFSQPINPCTDPRAQTYNIGPRAIEAGSFASDGSVLFSGPSVGVKMTNANGSGIGNDHAYDNIRILDVTPQLDKEFVPASIDTGDVATATFTVTNTTDLAEKSGFGFTDSLPAGVTVAATPNAATTCGAGTVAATAGGSSIALTGGVLAAGVASCTVTVDVTASAVGTYVNEPSDLTPTGVNPPGPAPITVTVPGSPSITKQVAESSFAVGQLLHYTYTVTNNSDQALSNVTVTDTGPGTPTVTCPPGSLAAGASVNCTATYTATQADADTGTVTNTANVTGTLPSGTELTAVSNQVVVPLRSLTITKAAEETQFSAVGETIHYTFTVTNNGRVPLSDITVTDFGPGAPAVTCPGGTLAPGATVGCTATHTTTAADVQAGEIVDSATATGTTEQGDDAEADSNTVTIPYVAPTQVDLAVVKTGPATVSAGGQITYSIVVTNNGPGNSTGWTLTDTIPADLSNAATSTPGCGIGAEVLTCTGGALANGASVTIQVRGTAAPGATVIENTARVTGEEDDPDPGNNTSTTTTSVPSVKIIKKQNGSATVEPGDTVFYTITVRNTGAAPTAASFTDDLSDLVDDAAFNNDESATVGSVTYDAPDLSWSGTLAPGQTATITFSITINERPFGDLKLDNTVVSETPGNNCPVTSDDPDCTTHGTVKVEDKDKKDRA
ncbi:DUF7507 domain-containing protein [Streptomyces sp. NBC_00690]|uniref:DUF7507 domain-containing protein n=1 Tax=Streptomyces sp. NBC_00690 TaxID=2975808 RepID=UPI002E28214E|nr:hypothetical protein [Streptomyces sp. NBC_00690]